MLVEHDTGIYAKHKMASLAFKDNASVVPRYQTQNYNGGSKWTGTH